MEKPKMILFDYGQTLVSERAFDGVAGVSALLEHAVSNKYGYTAQQVQAKAEELNRELGRFDMKTRHLNQVEIPNHMFTAYLYQSMGIQLALSPQEIDRIFWNAASPGVLTEGIEDFLSYLKGENIRTGVISNICYCGEVVSERINKMLPDNEFEFIIATSEYTFRKPNRHIFELALEKAGLQPEEAWYVGDSYECDVEGARGAGIFPVRYIGAVHTEPGVNTDVLTVSHWKQLEQILMEN